VVRVSNKSDHNNVNVEGSIDAGWSSYWPPDEQDGETVAASDDTTTGTMNTEFWPSHINPGELTDKQRETLRLAFEDPTRTASEIDDMIGGQQYANSILRDKVPEWYEDVFKESGGSHGGRPAASTQDDDTGDSEGVSESEGERVIEVLRETAVHEETMAVIDVLEDYL
jgi:hypothetical protein